MAGMSHTTFLNAFSSMKCVAFRCEFHWSLFLGFNGQWFSTGSSNGLAPNRRRAITWNNADPFQWRLYAALGVDELSIYYNGLFAVWPSRGHYDDVTMSLMASQITSLTIVYSTVYSGAVQRKLQSSASLAFVRGIHRGPVNSPHKRSVTRKMFPFDDVIMVSWRLFAYM